MVRTVQFFLTLTTIYYIDLNPVSGYSVTVFLACCVFTWPLAKRSRRETLSRQLAAASATWLATFWAYASYVTAWPLNADHVAGILLCLAFGFGYSLSGSYGPSRSVAATALLGGVVCLGTSSSAFLRMLNRVLPENSSPNQIPREGAMFLSISLAGLWAVVATVLVIRTRRHSSALQRMSQGECPECAYSLRGSVGMQSCPECGAAIPWDRVALPA